MLNWMHGISFIHDQKTMIEIKGLLIYILPVSGVSVK